MLSILSSCYDIIAVSKEGGCKMEYTNELDSMCGISDEKLTELFKEAIRIDNEIKKAKGAP